MGGKIIIAGATGFIGEKLTKKLIENDYSVIALSRNPEKHQGMDKRGVSLKPWDAENVNGWASEVDGSLALVNLAGENISSGLWTKKRKEKLYNSRMKATKALVAAIEMAQNKPEVIIQASAVGYYGSRGEETLDEESSAGEGFLARLCDDWEKTALAVEKYGVRLVRLRFGLVLGEEGPLMERLTLPYRLFLGVHFGKRNQWLSWIHRQDVINSILFAIEHNFVKGAMNVTSPNPVLFYDFMKTIGKRLHRPSWVYIPPFLIKLFLGEMAKQTIFSSQKVIPRRLQEWNYDYKYENLDEALKNIFQSG